MHLGAGKEIIMYPLFGHNIGHDTIYDFNPAKDQIIFKVSDSNITRQQIMTHINPTPFSADYENIKTDWSIVLVGVGYSMITENNIQIHYV